VKDAKNEKKYIYAEKFKVILSYSMWPSVAWSAMNIVCIYNGEFLGGTLMCMGWNWSESLLDDSKGTTIF
jgi:hypothetical protein